MCERDTNRHRDRSGVEGNATQDSGINVAFPPGISTANVNAAGATRIRQRGPSARGSSGLRKHRNAESHRSTDQQGRVEGSSENGRRIDVARRTDDRGDKDERLLYRWKKTNQKRQQEQNDVGHQADAQKGKSLPATDPALYDTAQPRSEVPMTGCDI